MTQASFTLDPSDFNEEHNLKTAFVSSSLHGLVAVEHIGHLHRGSKTVGDHIEETQQAAEEWVQQYTQQANSDTGLKSEFIFKRNQRPAPGENTPLTALNEEYSAVR